MSDDAPTGRLHHQLRHHIANTLEWPELREVQRRAIEPILDGDNTVLLAPTAGGKTEAAFFPIISRLLDEEWAGLSVLYLSPIRALLNNQFDRLDRLFGLVGYDVGIWHGDVSQSQKRKIREDPPNVLLTTPESLEGILISTKGSPDHMFGNLRATVIDEVHAFADDDRGWHLLGVLERLQHYASRDIQRLGLSATVGNPPEIAEWLGRGSERSSTTVDPPAEGSAEPDVEVDWVGTVGNAAKIIDQLFRGERRLVFCDSRLQAEKLARKLKDRGVTTYLNHSSLSREERRYTERAFAQGGPGAIIATSALELGIDIGDLDRVVQIDAPYSVASFLQRMGRTGRREGQRSNCLFLATSEAGLVRAAALIDLWKRGFVEDARPPSAPYQILAQQILACVLERPGLATEELMEAVDPFRRDAGLDTNALPSLVETLLRRDFLFRDGIRIGIGREGEETFGQRHFLELVSVFTSPPEFNVKHNTNEVGTVHQATFLNNEDDERTVILLAGRSWLVTKLDWDRKVAYVEPFDMPGKTSWLSAGNAMSRQLAEAHRDILTGSDCGADHWSQRAERKLGFLHEDHAFLTPDKTTVLPGLDKTEVWNFAGGGTNNYLADALEATGLDRVTSSALRLRIQESLEPEELRDRLKQVAELPKPPRIPPEHPLVKHLKFAELLPDNLLQEAARPRLWGTEYRPLPLSQLHWVAQK
ncbi:MAG: DEAD/DEAH box helicase [Bradymonadaceae bacterium]